MSNLRRRKVLWLSHVLPWPAKGGLQQRSFHLMRAVALRHSLRLVAFTQRAHQRDQESLASAIEEMGRFCARVEVCSLPQDSAWLGQAGLAAKSLLPGPPFTIRWAMSRRFAASVEKATQEFDPDIVHFDTVSLAPYLSQVPGRRAVLNHHNIESHMLQRRAAEESNKLRAAYFLQEAWRLARYEKRVAERFQLHLVCSQLDALRLAETVGAVSTRVVPNGVDLDYFQPAMPIQRSQEPGLIFVGGLGWYPNAAAMRYFLRSIWPLLKAARPDLQLTVVGRDPPDDLIKMTKQDGRVHFPGFVDDIRPLVHSSSVYVCPIRDGGGTKLKMLDAMAMGCAIVADPVAAEGLGIKNGIQCILAPGPRDFADAVLKLLDSERMRAELGARARKHVEDRFSFDSIGASLADTYQELSSRCAHQ